MSNYGFFYRQINLLDFYYKLRESPLTHTTASHLAALIHSKFHFHYHVDYIFFFQTIRMLELIPTKTFPFSYLQSLPMLLSYVS